MPNIVFIPNIATGDGRSTPYRYSVMSWKKWTYYFNTIPQNPTHVSYWMERTYNELYSKVL